MARTAKGGGTRGPIATPTHLKLAPDATVDEEKAAPRSVAELPATRSRPELPAGMTVTEVRLWEQLVDALDKAGLIGGCDGLTVEMAVRHYAAAVAAHKRLKREGVTIYDEKNQRHAKNPASYVFKEHSEAFRAYAGMLGLSFAARARIAVPERTGGIGDSDGEVNPFEPTG